MQRSPLPRRRAPRRAAHFSGVVCARLPVQNRRSVAARRAIGLARPTERTMRIAYLTSDFGVPVLGSKGASVHVRRLVSALAERGHELLVLTPNRGAGADETLPAELVEIPFDGSSSALHGVLGLEEIARGNRLA